MEDKLNSDDVRRLMQLFSSSQYKAKDHDNNSILKNCYHLFQQDYPNTIVINNDNGELASSYPAKLIIPQDDKCLAANEIDKENKNGANKRCKSLDPIKLKELMNRARIARCRARFPIPILIYDGKYVCRSSTLSGGPEIYSRSGLDFLFATNNETDNTTVSPDDSDHNLSSDSNHLFSRVRNQDIKLLKYLSVGYICDLMVEKKKVKFGMYVTSSEKVDKECRYSDFNIMSLPYPGCEFFRDYRDNGYVAEGLVYDWNQHFVDANLIVPTNDNICDCLNIDWKNYRNWDVLKLTQNYLKLLLSYLTKSDCSMLIHCISGWDRTPLFMSLLRLSLWADGKAHSKLSPIEITYLTVAYDWYLFGHNLNDRLTKGEEILFFCFYFLKYIISDEFSIDNLASFGSKERKQSFDNLQSEIEHNLLLEDNLSGYHGSSTSLNSSCSSASNKSQDPPMYFAAYSGEEVFGSLKSDASLGKTPPTLTNSEEGSVIFSQKINSNIFNEKCEIVFKTDKGKSSIKNGCEKNYNITEPVAIPVVSSKQPISYATDSPTLTRSDSWQLVSETGSIRDFSIKNSFNSPDSLSSRKSNGTSTSSTSSGEVKINKNSRFGCSLSSKSERKEKLQAVRSIFYNAYSASIGFKFQNGGDAPSISSLIDHFAGTVWNTRITAPH